MIRRKQAIRILLAAATVLIILAGPVTADWGKTEIQLQCYIGDRSDNEYIGTVDVFETVRAASRCNVMYNDCNGNCTACYDDETSREICVDSSDMPYYPD